MKPVLSKFRIYTKDSCDFCIRAKHTLTSMDLTYEEIRLEEHPAEREMLKSKGFKTVPQIYYDDNHIGGYTELVEYLNGKEIYSRKSA